MARILLTWELGGHLGHLSRLSVLADTLHKRGHNIALALRELHNVESIFRFNNPYQFFQAPIYLPIIKASRNPVTYSEILQFNGYLSTSSLRYQFKCWCSLIEMFKPQLIVYDYSPTAMLANKKFDIPAIELGTGFFIPPKLSPMPFFGDTHKPSLRQREKTDQQVITSINTILVNEKIEPISHVYELFDNSQALLTSFPELDCYQFRSEKVEYVGSLTQLGSGVHVEWSGKKERVFIFAYIKPSYQKIGELLSVFKQIDAEAKVYIPGCLSKWKSEFESEQITISDQPYAIDEAIEQADITICHAGHDTVVHSLLAGKPLLLIPQYVEQLEIAKCTLTTGAALIIDSQDEEKQIQNKIEELCQNKAYRNNALSFSKRYAHMDSEHCVKTVADICEAMLIES